MSDSRYFQTANAITQAEAPRPSIWPNVLAGIAVYVATRFIDRWFFSGGQR